MRIREISFTHCVTTFAFAVSLYIMINIFHGIPHVNDEGTYLFLAKMFAHGKLYINSPEPELIPCFKYMATWKDGKIYDLCPVGWPAILAIGFWLGDPQLIPPAMTAITVLFITLLSNQIYSTQWIGIIAGLLFLTSPLAMLLGASYMPHVPVMACITAFFFFLAIPEKRIIPIALLAGLFWGIGFNVRPVSMVAYSFIPLIYWGLRQFYYKRFLSVLIIIICMGIMVFVSYCHACYITGKWEMIDRQSGHYESFNDISSFWRFLNRNVSWLHYRAFGWPPYFTLMFAFLPFVLLSRNKWDWMFLCGMILNVVLYSLFGHYGWCHEPRYISETMPFICILSVRGIQRSGEVLKSPKLAGFVGMSLLVLLVLTSFKYHWPKEKKVYEDYCCVYYSTHDDVMKLPKNNAIYLFHGVPGAIYVPYFYLNDLDFAGDIIYAMYMPWNKHNVVAVDALLDKFPQKQVWIIENNAKPKKIRY